jgi:adenylosuccinate synthase
LDVLNDLDSIKVATAYEIEGQETKHFPGSLDRLAKAKPIYHELDGWEDWEMDSAEIAKKGIDALPRKMKEYIDFIKSETGVPSTLLGIGPRRDETIDLDDDRWD